MSLTELRRRAGLEVFLTGIPFERALLKVVAEHPELVADRARAVVLVERSGGRQGSAKAPND